MSDISSVSTGDFIQFPIDLDYETLLTEAITALAVAYPGWVAHEANLDVQLIEVMCRAMVETGVVASSVPPGIFRWFGRNLVNIQPIDAVSATTASTWTLSDTAGHTIRAGTQVSLPKSGDENVLFTVQSDVVVEPGADTTADDEVVLVAVTPGTDANGIAAGTATVQESLAWVESVTTGSTTSGGIDLELDAAYLSRLSRDLQLLSPAPILPADFEVLALNVAGVGRAHAVDGYNPDDGTSNNARMVAVAVADTAGQAVSGTIKTNVETYLQSLREVNFVVNAIDPTYNTVNVTVTVHKTAAANALVVQDDCVAALSSYLSPVSWDWRGVVRVNELISLLDQVDGVDYVSTPTAPSADLTLTGKAPLPTPGALTVVVA